MKKNAKKSRDTAPLTDVKWLIWWYIVFWYLTADSVCFWFAWTPPLCWFFCTILYCYNCYSVTFSCLASAPRASRFGIWRWWWWWALSINDYIMMVGWFIDCVSFSGCIGSCCNRCISLLFCSLYSVTIFNRKICNKVLVWSRFCFSAMIAFLWLNVLFNWQFFDMKYMRMMSSCTFMNKISRCTYVSYARMIAKFVLLVLVVNCFSCVCVCP